MRKGFFRDAGIAAALLAGIASIFIIDTSFKAAKPRLAGSTVKVLVSNGHGSGVNIGGGLILTAAHVVKDATEFSIKDDRGGKSKAKVLWANDEYDVALLRSQIITRTSELSCKPLRMGEALRAVGNPLDLEFTETHGRVAGTGPEGKVAVDITLAPGMSGGPVFDNQNRVRGINDAIMVMPMGFSGSVIGISYIVPSSTVCLLMGKF